MVNTSKVRIRQRLSVIDAIKREMGHKIVSSLEILQSSIIIVTTVTKETTCDAGPVRRIYVNGPAVPRTRDIDADSLGLS